MDITNFVVSTRQKFLVEGDYRAYRRHMSRKIRSMRKRLGIATKNRGKFQQKAPITAPVLAEANGDFVRLHVLTSERAWAHAMSMKAVHTANNQLKGSNRSHIISRLDKAARITEKLAESLSETDITSATPTDLLEAKAYSCIIRGAAHIERKKWHSSLQSYATSRIIYTALGSAKHPESYQDLLSETIDPSLRYAAYQLQLPPGLEIQTIARQAFPRSDLDLVSRIYNIDSDALRLSEQANGSEPETKTITWRGRVVVIQDPSVATAWSAVEISKARLAEAVASKWPDYLPKDKAASFDDLLLASHDAVDATKTAIDELRAESVTQSDNRIQSLLIARTAMSYEMVSWRIGRNRVLSGDHDGATMDSSPDTKRRQKRAAEEQRLRNEPPSKQLSRLKEKVALYNSTLQSLDTVKELPGVSQDEALSVTLDATNKYFLALKCLAIARSHTITKQPINALALIKRAFEHSENFINVLQGASPDGPPNIEVGAEDATFLKTLLQGELARCRALVRLEQLIKAHKEEATSPSKGLPRPLIDTLNEYPAETDLENIVPYPPKLELIPLKPLFFDIAWNYIEYPKAGGSDGSKPSVVVSEKPAKKEAEEKAAQKRGWFGFGR